MAARRDRNDQDVPARPGREGQCRTPSSIGRRERGTTKASGRSVRDRHHLRPPTTGEERSQPRPLPVPQPGMPHEIQSRGQVSLYFVPMACRHGARPRSPICHAGLQHRPEHGAAPTVDEVRDADVPVRRITPVMYLVHRGLLLVEQGLTTPTCPRRFGPDRCRRDTSSETPVPAPPCRWAVGCVSSRREADRRWLTPNAFLATVGRPRHPGHSAVSPIVRSVGHAHAIGQAHVAAHRGRRPRPRRRGRDPYGHRPAAAAAHDRRLRPARPRRPASLGRVFGRGLCPTRRHHRPHLDRPLHHGGHRRVRARRRDRPRHRSVPRRAMRPAPTPGIPAPRRT